jgi:hypothetical protein
VSAFSAGRHKLIRAAKENLEELEISGSAVVRWVRGRTGAGKTHLFARLIELAHERNWVATYVQISEPRYGAELHRFQEIYSKIVENCVTSSIVVQRQGKVEPGAVAGWDWILDDWWSRIRRLAGSSGGDLPSFKAQDEINRQMASLSSRWSLHPAFLEALKQYAHARVDGDEAWIELLRLWFKGQDVHSRGSEIRDRFRRAGILEPVLQRNSKDMLRSLSAFLAHLGYGGLLILLDEIENVLHQPKGARRTAYTLLKELIDNVDDRQGMVKTAFYASATPDVFDSSKGIIEYEALAERVLLPGGTGSSPAGAVVDLAVWPLTEADFLEMTGKIATIYGVAKDRPVNDSVVQQLRSSLHSTIKKNPDLTARSWVKTVIQQLDQSPAT